jgi:adenylate cyclase
MRGTLPGALLERVKNIAEPVRIYRVTGSQTISITQSKGAIDRPSVAILPLTNLSGDPEQQYFSDGITEDIITELSRFRAIFVIARNFVVPVPRQSRRRPSHSA